MGTDTIVLCEKCNEYAHLDKVPFPGYWDDVDTTEWFSVQNNRYQTMKLLSFMTNHMCHDVSMMHEASILSYAMSKALTADAYTEFELDRTFSSISTDIDND